MPDATAPAKPREMPAFQAGGECASYLNDHTARDPERRRQGLGRAAEVIEGGRLGIAHQRDARKAGHDLLEHRQPLAGDARLERQQAGEIAARPRQAHDEALADGVGDVHEHDRDAAALALQGGNDRRRLCDDHVGLQGEELFRQRLKPARLSVAEAIVDEDVAALPPSTPFEPLPESGEPRLQVRIVLLAAQQHANAPHWVALLRVRRERPRPRATEKRYELPPLDLSHSMTSSASASSLSGIVSPRALAVLRLMRSSNLVGWAT